MVQRATARRAPPRTEGSPAIRTAVSVLIPALAIGWVLIHIGAGPARTQLLGVAVLGWATAALLTRGWLGRLASTGAAVVVVAGVAAVAAGYLLLARSLGTLLAPSVLSIPSGSVPPEVGLIVVALLGCATLAWHSGRPAGHPLGRRAWALAAGVGRPRLPRDPVATARPPSVRRDLTVPVGVAA